MQNSYAVDWNNINMRGLYLNSADVNSFNPNELVNGGITDVFVLSSRYTNPKYDVNLPKVLSKLNGTGIRVHAWIICFSDSQGNFINPSNNNEYLNNLTNDIGKIVSDYDIDGVQLDYVRYPIENPAYQYSDGDKHVTDFVHGVRDKIKGIKPNVALSAALVPEWYEIDSNIVNNLNLQGDISKGVNTTLLYGQNYVEMSQYLDFLMPMVYRGFSLKLGSIFRPTQWVESTTRFAAERVNKPVISALTTYISNDEFETSLTNMSVNDLNMDIRSVYSGGGKGFALFRYGVLDKNFFFQNSANSTGSTIENNQTNNSPILNKTNPDNVFLNKTGLPLFIILCLLCLFGICYNEF